jgi:hypothetical protein
MVQMNQPKEEKEKRKKKRSLIRNRRFAREERLQLDYFAYHFLSLVVRRFPTHALEKLDFEE